MEDQSASDAPPRFGLSRASDTDAIGQQGELIVRRTLLGWQDRPLQTFQVSPLGDKFPLFDLLIRIGPDEPDAPVARYCFAQVKSTRQAPGRESIAFSGMSRDEVRSAAAAGFPAYLFAVDVGSDRIFVRAVNEANAISGIHSIRLANELKPTSLRTLYDEIAEYWHSAPDRPHRSEFL